MQNRPNASTQRGGDTVVMESICHRIRKMGVQVVIDLEGAEDPRNYDLVHLFNFTIPDMTRAFAERAYSAGVPYMVTTMYEDIPSFHNQSITVAQSLIRYALCGQSKIQFEAERAKWPNIAPSGRFENDWTARHAAALFTSGPTEGDVLRRDYPGINNVVDIMLGCELAQQADPEIFRRAFGVRDFILCVGRIESRKNQLMLLKALEDSELPVVLAGGGFTYQPEYDSAVRNFKRKGKTLVVGRLDGEMMGSMYAAAKVHALPSWYELPGIVSLEAAYHGCQIVATSRGTARDYFGDLAFYCEPDNESSILAAVTAAYHSPLNPELRESVMKYTWDQAAKTVLETYNKIAAGKISSVEASAESEADRAELEANLVRGEEAARSRDYAAADSAFEKALTIESRAVRALRGRGAIRLAQADFSDARTFFEQAYAVDANDPKTLSGLGMCDMMANNPEAAYPRFVRALEIDGQHLVTILQLLECSYRVNRFDDLVSVLRGYHASSPNDTEMTYCLAGALYKTGQDKESREFVEKVLAANPDHLGAKQLSGLLAERANIASQTSAIEAATPSPTPAISAGSEVDFQISELEEKKRRMEYFAARADIETLEAAGSFTAEQRERIQMIKAEILVLQGGSEEAGNIFSDVLRANPKSARAMCGLGAIEASLGYWPQAEAYFNQANEVRPGYDVALAGLALCSTWRKDYDSAWSFYCQALDKNAENVRALLGIIELGYPLQRLGDVESRLRAYLDSHPGDLEFVYALAGCCFAQNKCREALEEVQRITLFSPEHERANELKQMIQDKQKISGSVSA